MNNSIQEFTDAENSLQLRVNKDIICKNRKKRILDEIHSGESADCSVSEGIINEVAEEREG